MRFLQGLAGSHWGLSPCRTEDTAKIRAPSMCPHSSHASSSYRSSAPIEVCPLTIQEALSRARPDGTSPLSAAPFASMSTGFLRFLVSSSIATIFDQQVLSISPLSSQVQAALGMRCLKQAHFPRVENRGPVPTSLVTQQSGMIL